MEAVEKKGAGRIAEAVQIQCAAFLIPTQGFSPLFNASTQVHATPSFLSVALHFICKHL